MSNEDDIVARLRLSPVLMYSDQLGQSRIDYEACKKFINNEGVKMMREAADEIERLRAERDEARWEVCGFHHLTGFLAGDYAISRGWNYFNDERKWAEFPPSVTDFEEFLKGQDQLWLDRVDRLTRERDELRREVCEYATTGETIGATLLYANSRGWDCFKENTNG